MRRQAVSSVLTAQGPPRGVGAPLFPPCLLKLRGGSPLRGFWQDLSTCTIPECPWAWASHLCHLTGLWASPSHVCASTRRGRISRNLQPRLSPHGPIPTCVWARSPRLTPSWSPTWHGARVKRTLGVCGEATEVSPGGKETRLAGPPSRRAQAPRFPAFCPAASSWDRRLSHPLCGSHGQRDQNKVSVF